MDWNARNWEGRNEVRGKREEKEGRGGWKRVGKCCAPSFSDS